MFAYEINETLITEKHLPGIEKILLESFLKFFMRYAVVDQE